MRTSLFAVCLLCGVVAYAQDVAQLNAEGVRQLENGDYTQAREQFLKALEVSEKSQAAEQATALTNLGYTEKAMGNYTAAQQYFRQAIQSFSSSAIHHIGHIEAVIDLADAFLPPGQYDSCEYYTNYAEHLFNLAMRDQDDHYTSNIHLYYDAVLRLSNTKASLYHKKGQLQLATQELRIVYAGIRETYPAYYATLPVYRGSLNHLISCYLELGDLEHAKPLVEEYLTILSPDSARSVDQLHAFQNLAGIYRLENKPDSAIAVWKQALTVINQGYFYGSDIHIAILNNIGETCINEEHYPEGIEALTRSLQLQEERSIVNPRVYQTTLFNLSTAYHWSGRLKEADESYRRLIDIHLNEVVNNFTYLSDEEKISFYRSNVTFLESYAHVAFESAGAFLKNGQQAPYVNPLALGDLMNVLLTTKGLILHPGYRLRESILTGQDTLARFYYHQWEYQKNKYATLARSEQPDDRRLSTLKFQIEQKEKWLRSNSAAFRQGFVIEKKTWQDIQEALKPGEAAVEIVRLAGGLVYGVIILTPKTKKAPVFAMIKSTETMHLDNQYYKGYFNAVRFQLPDTLSYKRYWHPIEAALKKNNSGKMPRRVYVSTDGVYHRINLSTLQNPDNNRYVIDDAEICLVTNLKEILLQNSLQSPGTKHAVLVGRPQYYSTPTENPALTDLAGTEKEVDEIGRKLGSHHWKTQILKKESAQEARMKELQAPDVLHLATHGFAAHGSGEDPIHALLNSGIALAGAGDGSAEAGDDGILTAYEMMNLNLDSTRLVVLSACETGLGQFQLNEGVYGLQRALRSAGTRAVVMSLWKVDDTATQMLMSYFYSNWLEAPDDMRGAFRKAQQQLRLTYPAPFYWGAFVMVGE